jgi:S-DNA-T family DNA segregation ATPase FtsK/SpoIIIE
MVYFLPEVERALARRKKKSRAIRTNLKFELYGIIILILSVIALSREGSAARSLTYLFRLLIGTWDFVIPLFFIYIGLHSMVKREWPMFRTARKGGLLLIILGLVIMSHMSLFNQLAPGASLTAGDILRQSWGGLVDGLHPTRQGNDILTHNVGGGMVGALLYSSLYLLFDNWGARLIEFALFAIGFLLATGISYVDTAGRLRTRLRWLRQGFHRRFGSLSVSGTAVKPKAMGTRSKASPPIVPIEDDFDEESYPGSRKDSGKKPVFFSLVRSAKKTQETESSHLNGKGGDEFDDNEHFVEEQAPKSTTLATTVAMASSPAVVAETAAPLSNVLPHPANGRNKEVRNQTEADIPLIRDFQDHVDQEETIDSKGSEVASWGVEETAGALPMQAYHAEQVPYQLPPLNLLSRPASNGKNGNQADYMANARKLEMTLESFGVRAKVLEVVRGPAVTRYEIQPDVGVKVSRIVSLTDDIALALAAKDIRMEAPIPGKSAIGIEVPNTAVSVVTLREVLESSAYHESASKLTITLGRDIAGQPIVGNLARMPHLLVAGATGSGKSVCINGIITSILFKAKPNEVKFLMIDPKMVELNVYNGIPHLLAPVVTDPRRASLALKKVVVEMEKRYELFSKSGTRNIEAYNSMLTEKGSSDLLPFIVLIVDELADLMMVAASDVEDAICRLAQMARAAGIHLIIATQRPSVDVITGVIKANIPSRISFSVSSQVDSRTILDMGGAEKLLGNGDMLYLPSGASKPVRVQGAYLSDHEVEAIVHYASSQGKADFREELVPEVDDSADGQDEFMDELYDQAVQIVLEAKQASVSLLQRRMRIGYTRAARLIDSMEAKGVVGPYEGSKPREVRLTMDQYQHNRLSS